MHLRVINDGELARMPAALYADHAFVAVLDQRVDNGVASVRLQELIVGIQAGENLDVRLRLLLLGLHLVWLGVAGGILLLIVDELVGILGLKVRDCLLLLAGSVYYLYFIIFILVLFLGLLLYFLVHRLFMIFLIFLIDDCGLFIFLIIIFLFFLIFVGLFPDDADTLLEFQLDTHLLQFPFVFFGQSKVLCHGVSIGIQLIELVECDGEVFLDQALPLLLFEKVLVPAEAEQQRLPVLHPLETLERVGEELGLGVPLSSLLEVA